MHTEETKDSLTEMIPQENQVLVTPIGKTSPETITIYPFTLGQMPKVLRHIYALMRFISDEGKFDAKEMFMLGGEDVLMCLAIACNRPRAWFDTVKLDEGIELVAVVVNENQDFFVNHVMPHLTALTAKFKSATDRLTTTNETTGTGPTS